MVTGGLRGGAGRGKERRNAAPEKENSRGTKTGNAPFLKNNALKLFQWLGLNNRLSINSPKLLFFLRGVI